MGHKKRGRYGKNTLGAGSYGEVRKKGGNAVKKFSKETHLIAEYCAMRQLDSCKYVVHAIDYNLEKLELTMELYNRGSLRQYLREYNVTDNEVKLILRDILRGLIEVHSNGLAHGDLRPSNILINDDGSGKGIRAALGDLGFVSLAPYAKCERTAASHRDWVVKRGTWHDMFSFGIILLELLGGVRLDNQKNYEELIALTKRAIKCKETQNLILRLLSPQHEKRPSAIDCLRFLFNQTYAPYIIPKVRLARLLNEADNELASKDRRLMYISENIHQMCQKYEVNCYHRGKRALAIFFNREKKARRHYKFYSVIMVMLLSGVFGTKGMRRRKVLSECSDDGGRVYEVYHVYEALDKILACEDVRLMLLGNY